MYEFVIDTVMLTEKTAHTLIASFTCNSLLLCFARLVGHLLCLVLNGLYLPFSRDRMSATKPHPLIFIQHAVEIVHQMCNSSDTSIRYSWHLHVGRRDAALSLTPT